MVIIGVSLDYSRKMEKQLAFAALFKRSGNKILALYNEEKRILEFPGGEYDKRKDGNFLDTIIREIPEEIKLSGGAHVLINKEEFITYKITTQKNGDLIGHVYIGIIDGKVLGPTEEQREEGRRFTEWIEIKKHESSKLGQFMRFFCEDYCEGKFNLHIEEISGLKVLEYKEE